MNRVVEQGVPEGSLLQQCANRPGTYADAFFADVKGAPSLQDYIEAIFDSPVFRMERIVLAITVLKPAFRKDVEALAMGEGDRLAGWKTEQRTSNELLMAVENGQVRTWLKVEAMPAGVSRVWFGSAVVPKHRTDGKQEGLGLAFRLMLRVHKFYSRVLLRSATRRLWAHAGS